MKKLLIILLAVGLISCNPFISKDLRQKNKCNKKIEKEIKRHKKKAAKINLICPGALSSDTIRDTIEVEVEIPSTEIDSFIVVQKDYAAIDSLVNLIKNNKTREIIRKYITEYVPIKDTIIHLKDGYTIKFWSKDGKINYTINKPKETKIVEVPTETIVEELKPIPLTVWEQIMNFLGHWMWWIIIILAILVTLRYLKRIILFFKNLFL